MAAESYAPIDNSGASGDLIIVAAPGANQCIQVLGYTLKTGGQANLQWWSGPSASGTAMSGVMPYGVNDGTSQPVGPAVTGARGGQMQCQPGQALVLNVSAAVQVGGHLAYRIGTPS